MDTLADRLTANEATISISNLDPKTRLIKLSGELDNLSWPDLSSFIESRLSMSDKGVVLDLSDLKFADSSSIKLISGLAERFGPKNCHVKGVNPNIMRVMDRVQFDGQLFEPIGSGDEKELADDFEGSWNQ